MTTHTDDTTEHTIADDGLEHTFLVAVTITGGTRAAAEEHLHTVLPAHDTNRVESWWVAEDDRADGSDNDAAVFVPQCMTQAEADVVLRTLSRTLA